MKLLDIADMENIKSISILIRHAERFDIYSIKDHMNVELTEKGKSDAVLLGKKIAGRFDSADIYHSSVKRCRQTAESICNGMLEAGKDCSIKGEQDWLGVDIINPDSTYIDSFVRDNGPKAFYKKWLGSGFPREAINPYNEIAETKLSEIKKQLADGNGFTINVSHDWNLMTVLRHYFNLYNDKIIIPGFLDHIIFALNDNGIMLWYGDHYSKI